LSVEYNVPAFIFKSTKIFFFFQYGNEIVLFYKGLNTTGRVGIKIQRTVFFCTVTMFICTKLTCNNLTENGILDADSVN